MSKTVRRRLTIAALAFLHLLATALFSFSMLAFVLQRHHHGLASSEVRQQALVATASQITEFPLMTLARFAAGSAAIRLTPLLWLANSVLWAFVVYALWALIVGKTGRRPTDS